MSVRDDREERRSRSITRSFMNKKLSRIEKEFNKKFTLSNIQWDKFDFWHSRIDGYVRGVDIIKKHDEEPRLVQFNTQLTDIKEPAKFGKLKGIKFAK